MKEYGIIAGFGLPGRAAADALEDKGIPYCVIELNAATVTRCSRVGVPIIEGNASDPGVLEKAGVDRATVIVIAVPDENVALKALELARKMNAQARIVIRCTYTSAGLKALGMGANDVVVAEKAVAAEFARVLG